MNDKTQWLRVTVCINNYISIKWRKEDQFCHYISKYKYVQPQLDIYVHICATIWNNVLFQNSQQHVSQELINFFVFAETNRKSFVRKAITAIMTILNRKNNYLMWKEINNSCHQKLFLVLTRWCSVLLHTNNFALVFDHE